MAISNEQFAQLKAQLQAKKQKSTGLAPDQFEALKQKLRLQKEAKANPLLSSTREGKLFGTAANSVIDKAKQTYGEDSLAYKLTLPGRAAQQASGFLGDMFTANTQKLGKTTGEALAAPGNTKLYDTALQQHNEAGFKLQQVIAEKKKLGKDTSRLEDALDDLKKNKPQLSDFVGADTARRMGETFNQNLQEVGGQALGTVVEATAGGLPKLYKPLSVASNSFKLVKPTVQTAEEIAKAKLAYDALSFGQKAKTVGLETAKDIARTGPFGYAYDVSSGLQGDRGENREGGKAFIPGAGSLFSVAAPAAIGTFKIGLAKGKDVLNNKVVEAVDNLEEKYIEWSTGTKAGKKRLTKTEQKTEMLNKSGTQGKTPARILAESGITPDVSGTKFNTYDQAQEFRQGIAPLRDANKSALAEAGLSTVPSKLDDLEKEAIQYARTPENINSGRASKMEADIKKEFDILRSEYPDGNIPLGLQDDIKSARWDNVFKNKGLVDADVLRKDSEYAIAKAFQKNIEEVAEQAGHAEVAQLNREIGDRLEAAKFLESLDGNTLKGGRVGKFVGTLIGSSVAESIPGKIVGAIGGNLVADLLIKSSVNSPVRRAILQNLQKTDPEAFTETMKWLAKQDELRGNRLALPSGKGSPINLGGEKITTYEKPAQIINRQKQPDQLLLPAGNKNLNVSINQGRPIVNLPKGNKEYVGAEVITGGYSKSPTTQQTNTAITTEIKNPISDTIPQNIPKVNPNISQKAADLTKKNGGVTINLDGDVPEKGFAYSPYKDVETIIPEKDFNQEHVDKFIETYYNKLNQEGNHLGIWVDNGKVYIDISKVNPNENAAVIDSLKNNQLGLFDLSTFETKYIKDYEKTNNAYTHKGQKQGTIKEGNTATVGKEKKPNKKVTLPKQK